MESTLEFTTRLARLLAKKTRMPVYVGNSISLANTGLGGTVEEEMEVFAKVVEVAMMGNGGGGSSPGKILTRADEVIAV